MGHRGAPMSRIYLENKLGFGSIFRRLKNGKPLSNLFVLFKGKEYAVGSPRIKDAEKKLCQLRADDSRAARKSGPAVLIGELLDDVVNDYREKEQSTVYLKIYN